MVLKIISNDLIFPGGKLRGTTRIDEQDWMRRTSSQNCETWGKNCAASVNGTWRTQVIDDNCPYSTTKTTVQVKLAKTPFVRYFLVTLSIVPRVVTMPVINTMWSLKKRYVCATKYDWIGMREHESNSSVEIVETKFFQRYFWFLSSTLLPLALKDRGRIFPSSRQPSYKW